LPSGRAKALCLYFLSLSLQILQRITPMNYILKNLGFSSYFEQHFLPFRQQGFPAGRIATENKNQYTIFSENGILQAEG
jgi:hypothetical protein